MNQYHLNVTISANTKEEAEQELRDIMQTAADFPAFLTASLLLKYANDMLIEDLKDAQRLDRMKREWDRKREEKKVPTALID